MMNATSNASTKLFRAGSSRFERGPFRLMNFTFEE
jgi:hypothetical protein